jgi:hypothetical protein
LKALCSQLANRWLRELNSWAKMSWAKMAWAKSATLYIFYMRTSCLGFSFGELRNGLKV